MSDKKREHGRYLVCVYVCSAGSVVMVINGRRCWAAGIYRKKDKKKTTTNPLPIDMLYAIETTKVLRCD